MESNYEEIKNKLDIINAKLDKIIPHTNIEKEFVYVDYDDIRKHHKESFDKLYADCKYLNFEYYHNNVIIKKNMYLEFVFLIMFTDIDKYMLQVLKYKHRSLSHKISCDDSVYNLLECGKLIFGNKVGDTLYDFVGNVIRNLDR